MVRIFVYDGREFPDPDPKLSTDEVRQSMANFFPELSNAETKDLGERKPASQAPDPAQPVADPANPTPAPAEPAEVEHLWEFKKRVGTKG